VSLDVLDVVQLGSKRVVDVNDNDLPVSLLLVEKGHDTEDLDLLDLASVADELADLADIERIVVTLGLGLGVDGVGVLPGLFMGVSGLDWSRIRLGISYLGEGTVVPEVTLVGEAVSDVSKLALLDVLLDGVEELLLGDLVGRLSAWGRFGETVMPKRGGGVIFLQAHDSYQGSSGRRQRNKRA
jgi:hypothetical protein